MSKVEVITEVNDKIDINKLKVGQYGVIVDENETINGTVVMGTINHPISLEAETFSADYKVIILPGGSVIQITV